MLIKGRKRSINGISLESVMGCPEVILFVTESELHRSKDISRTVFGRNKY